MRHSSEWLTLGLANTTCTAAPAAQTQKLPGPVLVGQRYAYRMVHKTVKGKMGLYVRCVDTMKREHRINHGPFTREQAQAMIDARVKRDEDLRRAL